MLAYIALGSNLHNPKQQILDAVERIKQHKDMDFIAGSSIYLSAPIGPQDQDDFHNACISLSTDLSPEQLLEQLQLIEQIHERKRLRHWGPRTLDLDIVYCENISRNSDKLTIPHPLAHERLFVLLPLKQLAPDIELNGESLATWIERNKSQTITCSNHQMSKISGNTKNHKLTNISLQK